MLKLYRFHINVLLSIWFVVACLLGLQLGLNYLKYQSLVIDTTSARLQIAGSTIETVARRAEQVGLGLDEIRNLDSIIDREMRREPLIDTIRIVAIDGAEIGTTANEPLPDGDLNRLMRRITIQDSPTARLEIGDTLHSARRIIDSTGSMIGAVVISSHRGNYRPEVLRAHRETLKGFMIVFCVIAGAVVPLVLFGFKKVGRVMAVFEEANLNAVEPLDDLDEDDVADQMRALIIQGNRAYAEACDELEALVADDASKTGAR
ncbi:MAG: PDC sensor domain-containing protein [Pseudomonadota bacterium]